MTQTLLQAMEGSSQDFLHATTWQDALRNSAIYDAFQKTLTGILADQAEEIKKLLEILETNLQPAKIPTIAQDSEWQEIIVEIIIRIGQAHTQMQKTIYNAQNYTEATQGVEP